MKAKIIPARRRNQHVHHGESVLWRTRRVRYPESPSPRHPMECQSRHKKEEYQHKAQLDKKQQHESSKFFLVDFEETCRPGCAGIPKQERRSEIEQGEDEADDECGEEEVSEKNDLIAIYAAIIYFSDARSITNR
jgi:hypothetical protein